MRIVVLIVILLVSFSQSSYAGLFKFDPEAKFKEADYMISIDRHIAADKLISEVIAYCKKKNDDACLAKAFFYYGKLLMAEIPDGYDREKNSARRPGGSYVDDSVTVGNIDQKAMEYFDKALALAKKHGINDAASAIYIKIGILQYTRFKDSTAACESFDRSLEYYLLFKKDNPNTTVIIPKGFDSFEEYIAQGKREMGCQK